MSSSLPSNQLWVTWSLKGRRWRQLGGEPVKPPPSLCAVSPASLARRVGERMHRTVKSGRCSHQVVMSGLDHNVGRLTSWRNGSASDSRSEGCVFKSRRGQGNLAFLVTSVDFIYSPYFQLYSSSSAKVEKEASCRHRRERATGSKSCAHAWESNNPAVAIAADRIP